jgi:lambda repressor-like predicted transcriptional regulator
LLEQRKLLVRHIHIAAAAKRGRRYMNDLADLDQMLGKYWMQVNKVHALAEGIMRGDATFDLAGSQKENDAARAALAQVIQQLPVKKKKGKKKKKSVSDNELSTADITLQMFKTGKSIAEIAATQDLAPSTIEEHLARAVEKRRITLAQFLDQTAIDEITAGIAQMEDGFTVTTLRMHLHGKYGYGQLRAVISDLVNRNNLA